MTTAAVNDTGLQALRIVRDALDTEPGDRDAFIASRCGNDTVLRERVEAMLCGAGDADGASDGDAGRVDAIDDPLVGRRLGPFRLVERIGRGGMGVVYRGERVDGDFAQTVAVKLIRRGFDFDDIQARFLRERRILARLSHPNLARLIDGGLALDGRPWFALEFVDGSTITRWCDARHLGVRDRVRLFLDVCAAVQYAHGQLVVHRDLKPGNILVDDAGTVRLLDFGIARLLEGNEEGVPTLTVAGTGYGLTPQYAAPEQFDGAVAGVGADVYSLGVILYELIAGVGPYALARNDIAAAQRTVREVAPEPLTQAISRSQPDGSDSNARLDARRTSLPAYRATVRGDLSRILGKALAKEPDRRYATVEGFAEDLSRWLEGAPVRVSGDGLGYRLSKFVRRNRAAVTIATVLALALVLASVLALRSAWSERIQRQAALAEAARVTAVRDYTLLMFREAGERGDGTKATARDVLARGAQSIFTRFADRPAEGLVIADNLAELYMQLGDIEGAAPLLERLIAWSETEASPEVRARAQYNLAQVEYMRGNTPRSRELLAAAQAWWSGEPERHGLILSESRIMQARLLRDERRFDEAIAMLEASIAERRRLVGNDREVLSALATWVNILSVAGRYDEAIDKADEGLRLAEQAGDEALVLALLNNRGSVALQLERYDEAVVDFRRVVDTRRELFGRSPDTAVALTNLAVTMSRAMAASGQTEKPQALDEQIALLEESYEMARSFGGEAGRATVMVRPALTDTYLRAGRLDEAQPLIDDGLRIALASHGDASLPTGVAWRARAQLRIARHDDPGARADLDQARAVFERMGEGGKVFSATLDPLYALLDARASD